MAEPIQENYEKLFTLFSLSAYSMINHYPLRITQLLKIIVDALHRGSPLSNIKFKGTIENKFSLLIFI